MKALILILIGISIFILGVKIIVSGLVAPSGSLPQDEGDTNV